MAVLLPFAIVLGSGCSRPNERVPIARAPSAEVRIADYPQDPPDAVDRRADAGRVDIDAEDESLHCPAPEPRDSTGAQMWTVRGFGEAYEFLAHWTGQAVSTPPTLATARSVVCHVFATAELDAMRRSVSGESFAPSDLDHCSTVEAVSFRLLPPVDELDGSWHLLSLPGAIFVSMYEAPNRSQTYPDAVTSLRREGAFAVREVSWPAFVCPSDDDDVCVAWHPRDPDAEGFYCTDEKALPCAQHGYDTELYVIDPVTERAIRFGPFTRQRRPKVEIIGRSIRVTARDCVLEETVPR